MVCLLHQKDTPKEYRHYQKRKLKEYLEFEIGIVCFFIRKIIFKGEKMDYVNFIFY